MSNWDCVASVVDFNLEIDDKNVVNLVSNAGKVLDFGCGYGRITEQLFNLGYIDIVGVDSSVEMVHRGRDLYPHLPLMHVENSTLPFNDNTFDAVITCAVFTCIANTADRLQTLNELQRVLKPEGVLYLAEFCADESTRFTSSVGVPMWHSTPAQLESLLGNMSIIHTDLVSNTTMTGQKSKACHLFSLNHK